MAQEPANKRLWETLTLRARSKFRTYPSPAASHWVHAEYEKFGGHFIDTAERAKHERLGRQFHEKREELKKDKDSSPKRSKSKDK
jgi:hypothetical protein